MVRRRGINWNRLLRRQSVEALEMNQQNGILRREEHDSLASVDQGLQAFQDIRLTFTAPRLEIWVVLQNVVVG